MNEEILELKELIISGLNLEDVAPGDINDDERFLATGSGSIRSMRWSSGFWCRKNTASYLTQKPKI